MYRSFARAAAAGLILVAVPAANAMAHAVCGDRVFPATLAIDDPGVNDELAIPTVTYLPSNSNGEQEFDLGAFSWSKTIFSPNIDITFADGATWLHPGGHGWDPLSTEAQWGNFCWAEHEFMATLGFTVSWANTGTGSQTQPFNTYQPVIDVGKGFGDLPNSLNQLRPLAVTFELSQTSPGQARTDGIPNPFTFNGGFTIQYSLPYLNSNVAAIDNDFFRHLIPLTELAFTKPVTNFAPGPNPAIGTIQPGVIYLSTKFQVGVEAVLPLNSASSHGVGVMASIDLYLDDLAPDSVGKPWFPLFGAPQR
jgi:hypothetical protein